MPKTSTELTADFLAPWAIDIHEQDDMGTRSYAVYGRRQELLSQGVPVDAINYASTAAALIVQDLYTIGELND